jgi:transposase
MKYTQNEKILQIKERTLIIGVDIASETHYARAFDNRGIEYGKLLKFNNDAVGFDEFSRWATAIMEQNHKQEAVVGMEPTGHYWFPIAQYLKDNRMKIVLVLVKDGRYMEPYIPEGIYSDIRNASDTRCRLVKQLNSIRNRVERWLSIYFPEFNDVFGSWEGKAAMMSLNEFPTPEKVVEKGDTGIVACWRREITRGIGVKRAVNLVEAAKVSVGVRSGLRAAENELDCLLEEYAMLMRQYESSIELLEELVMKIPGVTEMLGIKGIGLITVAGFIAEVGDINRFEHPKQIQKLAGLNLKENSSGKHKGKTSISKRGRRRLRSLLFQCMIPLLANNSEFKEIHRYYTTRENNPLKKKQLMILMCCKLIRVFFALMKKNVEYNPDKMMGDITRTISMGNAA